MISTKRIVKRGLNKVKRTIQEEKIKRYTRYFVRTLAFLLILGLIPTVYGSGGGTVVAYKVIDAVATWTFRLVSKNMNV